MKLQKETAKKIIRDAAISIFLYALPVVLMFLTFYIKGQRPWQQKSESLKTTINNK
jgi:hypothetical protein